MGFVDSMGKIVIPFTFENARGFIDHHATVIEKDAMYLINKSGKKICKLN